MYISPPLRPLHPAPPGGSPASGPSPTTSDSASLPALHDDSSLLYRLRTFFTSRIWAAASSHERWSLRKRDSLQDQNVMIGAIVGVVLFLFIIGLIYFFYRYHNSIRFSRRSRSRRGRYGGHHRYGSSKGSNTSSDVGGPPVPPPPPA
ncbi:hypothetical protein QBC47DRAFT_392029 [Echria macrotheca]|uniref:Uncharacterized protein n=1 Tax=Echria macrotheca TaxID=438768 RepID=A0AAJ0B4R0_9PEZI|nr:hypothetical protein QBC47DRAFT_392029 [Echria macrotheca]